MNQVPLWKLARGFFGYDFDSCFDYGGWDEFILDEPWTRDPLTGNSPHFWKVYHPDDPDYDEKYDTPSLGLVYTSLVPLRAYSVRVELDPDADQTQIEEWLIKHNFLKLGG